MGKELTNKEFDDYMDQTLHEYLSKLDKDYRTSEDMFQYNADILVNLWKDIFYQETNRRIATVRCEDKPAVAKTIVELWMTRTGEVEYIDCRVKITRDRLNEICMDLVNKFYLKPPCAKG